MSNTDYTTYLHNQVTAYIDLLYRETTSRRKRLRKKLKLRFYEKVLQSVQDNTMRNSNCISFIHVNGSDFKELKQNLAKAVDNIVKMDSPFYLHEKLNVTYDVSADGEPLYHIRIALSV